MNCCGFEMVQLSSELGLHAEYDLQPIHRALSQWRSWLHGYPESYLSVLQLGERIRSALQHAHCAHFEALPANDAIEGSGRAGPEGSGFTGWLWGPRKLTPSPLHVWPDLGSISFITCDGNHTAPSHETGGLDAGGYVREREEEE